MTTLWAFEEEAQKKGYTFIAGVDEAGRGPLAGPVVAAACIIPEGVSFSGINDSKKLSEKKRDSLFQAILHQPHLFYGIGVVHSLVINQINILQATFLAMQKAIQSLEQKPDYILVDGNCTPFFGIPSKPIIKGDSLSQSIMAASIIAKCTRDLLMKEYHLKWPMYGFNEHKGYGTKKHFQAIKEHGACPIHRNFGILKPIAPKEMAH